MTLSVIRHLGLGREYYQGVFEVVLTALKRHGLFRGRHLGIDSSVIEADAESTDSGDIAILNNRCVLGVCEGIGGQGGR